MAKKTQTIILLLKKLIGQISGKGNKGEERKKTFRPIKIPLLFLLKIS